MRKIIAITIAMLCMQMMNAFGQDTLRIKTTAQCDECKHKIETALNYTKGVKSATLDIHTMVATVVYNPAKTNPDKLRDAISRAGYDADAVPADPKAYARLKPCCTKDGHKHD